MRQNAISSNIWTINCSKYADSKYGMSSSIIKDMKYHKLRSLTLVILELLLQISDVVRAYYIFSIIFSHFWSHFVVLRPHMVTLRNFDGTIF